jgi:hypothetical protein
MGGTLLDRLDCDAADRVDSPEDLPEDRCRNALDPGDSLPPALVRRLATMEATSLRICICRIEPREEPPDDPREEEEEPRDEEPREEPPDEEPREEPPDEEPREEPRDEELVS